MLNGEHWHLNPTPARPRGFVVLSATINSSPSQKSFPISIHKGSILRRQEFWRICKMMMSLNSKKPQGAISGQPARIRISKLRTSSMVALESSVEWKSIWDLIPRAMVDRFCARAARSMLDRRRCRVSSAAVGSSRSQGISCGSQESSSKANKVVLKRGFGLVVFWIERKRLNF